MGETREHAAAAAARRTSHETNPLSSIVASRLHDRLAAAGGTFSHVGSVPLKDKSGFDVGTADVIAITPVPKKKISSQSLHAEAVRQAAAAAAMPSPNSLDVLKTIPYETAMERTFNWIWRENLTTDSAGDFEKLPARGGLPAYFPFRDHYEDGIEEYETSISRCESDRGTHGRGSPPLDWDQSRLQDLYTQLLIRQAGARVFLSQNNRRVKRQGEDEDSADANQLISHVYKKFGLQYIHSVKAPLHGLPDLVDSGRNFGRRAGVYQPPVMAKLAESTGGNLDPFLSAPPPPMPEDEAAPMASSHPAFRSPREKRTRRQTIKIGRTFSSKKPATLNLDNPYSCEWKKCRDTFASARDLFLHAEEHVCSPGAWNILGEGGFRCCWRTCPLAEQSKVFNARYQLLCHLQNTHCGEKIHRISIQENEAPPIFRPLDEERDRTTALPKIEIRGTTTTNRRARSRRNVFGDEPETPRSGSLRRAATSGLVPHLKGGRKSKKGHRGRGDG
eukprot:m.309845 g.309845  ORF g.309845 m.309845 type:complete len:504 (+) comp48263_c0_seq1:211-1722(+)